MLLVKNVLVLSSLLLLSVSGVKANPNIGLDEFRRININSDVYGPYEKRQQGNTNVTLKLKRYSEFSIAECNIRVLIYSNRTGYLVTSSTRESITLYYDSYFDFTFKLPVYEFLTDKGLRIKIELTSNFLFSLYKVYEFNLYPYIKQASYNALNYVDEPLTVPGTSFYFQNGDLYFGDDLYTFTGFEDYFLLDRYYRLEFKQFSFQYSGISLMAYGSASATIIDPPDCFKYLDKDEDDNAVIPLIAFRDIEGNISLKIKSGLWVNKRTLMMANRRINNDYVASQYFYLPHNYNDEVLNKTFRFTIKNINKPDYSLFWDVSYLTTRRLVGDCSNSDYCVVGGDV